MSITGAELARPFSSRRRLFAHADRSALLRWTTLALLLCFWEAGARIAGNAGLIAPPTSVARALITQVLSDADVRGALFSAVLEISAAYALAVSGGLAIGLAVGWTRFGRNSMFPIILLFYAIPQAVLLPLFTLGFGIGPAAKIAFGCSHGIFPVIVNTVAGMRNINPLYVSAARAMGASRRDIIRNVIMPHMVGSFFAGLRLAMTMTLLGVILAELYVSTGGIGFYTRQFADNFDPAPLFALVLALAMIAIAMNALVRFAERRYTRWKD
ncbi:MAG: ABC transporter permease [Alphaproteobacteria bacterium]|nr:ABC transporter permease [Alphaproteobacteria bacterium]